MRHAWSMSLPDRVNADLFHVGVKHDDDEWWLVGPLLPLLWVAKRLAKLL